MQIMLYEDLLLSRLSYQIETLIFLLKIKKLICVKKYIW